MASIDFQEIAAYSAQIALRINDHCSLGGYFVDQEIARECG